MRRETRRLFTQLAFGIAACFSLFRVIAAESPTAPGSELPTSAGEQSQRRSERNDGGGAPVHADWKLAWEDDFSKDQQIDKSKWNFEINGRGEGNGELEYYTDSPKNAHIEDGELVITALKGDGGHKFTSARMTTSRKFSCLFGRIEASIKAPKAQAGNWPAFWMMPQDNKYGGWPRSGEIDIMELINKSDTLYGTCHYGGEHGDVHSGAEVKLASGDYSQDYHIYAVEWEPKEIRWYVDNKSYGSITKWHSANAPFPAPFDQKFYIILNYAVGGQWPRSPDASSIFPQSMHVKYVRVYQP
jgi:beta-glucanase (GH16 family)